MRTISAAQEKVLSSSSFVSHLRVLTKGADEEEIDLTTLEGKNWVRSASWGDSVENQVASAKVQLVAAMRRLNLAPLDGASKLNAVGPALGLNREIKIETASLPKGVAPTAGDWQLMFHGYIDAISWESDPITLDCRDLGKQLQETWIEKEYVYGPVKNQTSCRTWAPNEYFAAYESVLPTSPNGYSYQNTDENGGLTGSTEPVWPTTFGIGVEDGTPIWTCMGPAPDRYGATPWQPATAYSVGDLVSVPYGTGSVDVRVYRAAVAGTSASTTPDFSAWGMSASDGTVTWQRRTFDRYDSLEMMIREMLLDHFGNEDLSVPAASGWILSEWRQQRTPVLDAIRNLAGMIGWDVRYRYDSSTGSFRLTLYSPDRTKTTPDRTFTQSQYHSIDSLSISSADIRNVVEVVYSDSSAVATNGIDYQRKTVSVSNAASIAKYGRRWCEIAEASASNIDTATEATALANAALSDLCEPTAEQSVSMRYFWPVDTGDLYRFTANGKHSSTDLDLAVVAYEHTFADGRATTKLTCRGKPTLGGRRWHKRLARPGVASSSRTAEPNAPTNVTVTNAAGRSLVKFIPYQPDYRAETELYVSTSSGFTPSGATLEQRGFTNSFTVFRSAGTYYGKLITRDRFGNESAPSSQFTLAPT